jgi:hypothetical protein
MIAFFQVATIRSDAEVCNLHHMNPLAALSAVPPRLPESIWPFRPSRTTPAAVGVVS